ncbi:MAG TPA: dienelactone hydrolase family protein [Candidatus Baltobacteraceae bacterium]|nr:dienelactone hydrolase family protein [Candidatus Baltobacteraceae bacterium]
MKVLSRNILKAAVIVLLATATATAQTDSVSFPSLDKTLHGQLTATVYRPSGDGPFPAMVLLHTCAGVQPYVGNWAQWLAGQGYEAIVVDSFGPRGVGSVCGIGGYPDERARALDAYGALVYLRTRPEVDGTRIGVIGWSHGGGAALAADDKGEAEAYAAGNGFRAAIAFYPVCGFMPRDALSGPMLVLLGANDDWTGATPCDRAVKRLAGNGQPVSDYIYPGATHSFDNPADRGVTHIHNHYYTLDYDAGAAQDAHARVAAFLAGTMK